MKVKYTTVLALLVGLSGSAKAFQTTAQIRPMTKTSLAVASAEPPATTKAKTTTSSSSSSSSDESLEFPPPLSAMDRFKRAATFWSTALPIAASYYGLISQIKLREVMGQAAPDVEALWDAQHEEGTAKLAATVSNLKGFYVKTAQIISSRRDLFPAQYTDALSDFTDNVDPMPASLAKAVVESELLHSDERFEDVFSEFDETPLGAASVAQVHRAVLTEKYGGREVAVKIQYVVQICRILFAWCL